MLINIGRSLCSAVFTKKTGQASLKDAVSSCVFDVDATVSASYAGSGQSFKNLVATPADGAAKAAYDFYLGADGSIATDDPTFTGTAGNPSAYFLFDGGDFFQLASGVNTAFLNALHKTTGGTSWWVAMAYKPLDIATTDFLWSTNAYTGNTRGMGMFQASNEVLTLQQRGDSASVTPTPSPAAVTPATDTLAIFSCDTSGNVRRWVNTRSKSAHTWTLNATSTDAGQPLRIGGRSNNNNITNGTRLYAMSMGNAFIDDAQAALLINAYNTRHGRIYA